MLFLIVGDCHFTLTNELRTNILHQKILQVIIQHKPKYIVLLGDLLDKHEKIDLNPFNRVQKMIKDIHELNVEIFILIGNHDISGPNEYMTDVHAFNPFKQWNNVHVIDRCTLFEREINFVCCPYIPNGRFLEALDDCNITERISEVQLLFCHSEFTGTKINKLSKSKCDTYPENYPLNIAGHLHDEERIGNLYYIGTPMQHSFSEKPNKGVCLIDENLNITKIKLDIPQKTLMEINYTQIHSIVIPEGEVKIKIRGPINEIKLIMSDPIIKEKFKNVSVGYIDMSTPNVIPEYSHNTTFSDEIKKEISKDSKIYNLFVQTFEV